jgi:large subunit ribosomal protein L3
MTGLIGKKLGMTQYFAPDGRMHAVTVVEAGPCTVTQLKSEDRDGYTAVQLGYGTAKRLSQAEKGHLGFPALGRNRKRKNQGAGNRTGSGLGMFPHLKEFPYPAEGEVNVGDVLTAEVFTEGQRIDVTGVSKGKGFAGGIKRYHFRGGPKTHGQSDRHRAPGSIGSGTTPGRVYKGLHMAGHLGDDRVTAKNLQVLKVETDRNLIFIKGAVPGPTDGVIVIRPTKKGSAGK